MMPPDRKRIAEPLKDPENPTCVACRNRLTFSCKCKKTLCRLGAQPGNERCKPQPIRD